MWCPPDKISQVEKLALWVMQQPDWVCSGDVPVEFGKTKAKRALLFSQLCSNSRYQKHMKVDDNVVQRGPRATKVKSKFIKVFAIAERLDLPRPVMGVNATTGQVAEFKSLRDAEIRGGFDEAEIRFALKGLARMTKNGFSRANRGDLSVRCYSQGYIWLDLTKITP